MEVLYICPHLTRVWRRFSQCWYIVVLMLDSWEKLSNLNFNYMKLRESNEFICQMSLPDHHLLHSLHLSTARVSSVSGLGIYQGKLLEFWNWITKIERWSFDMNLNFTGDGNIDFDFCCFLSYIQLKSKSYILS